MTVKGKEVSTTAIIISLISLLGGLLGGTQLDGSNLTKDDVRDIMVSHENVDTVRREGLDQRLTNIEASIKVMDDKISSINNCCEGM